MTKYAVYDASRIFHLMRDEKHTYCGVRVFGGHADDDYRGNQSPSRIVDSIPDGLRMCPHCANESDVKKGGNQVNDGKDDQQQTPLMVEDKATEKLKKRAQDAGLIVNTSVGKSPKQSLPKKTAKK